VNLKSKVDEATCKSPELSLCVTESARRMSSCVTRVGEVTCKSPELSLCLTESARRMSSCVTRVGEVTCKSPDRWSGLGETDSGHTVELGELCALRPRAPVRELGGCRKSRC
jgi:hypothetical protein